MVVFQALTTHHRKFSNLRTLTWIYIYIFKVEAHFSCIYLLILFQWIIFGKVKLDFIKKGFLVSNLFYQISHNLCFRHHWIWSELDRFFCQVRQQIQIIIAQMNSQLIFPKIKKKICWNCYPFNYVICFTFGDCS